jgi:ABC-type nickel/cobalt efflux system permease component RcnA
MKNKKLMATLCLIGVLVVIAGNIINNTTYWIFSDIYTGLIMAVAGYMFWRR